MLLEIDVTRIAATFALSLLFTLPAAAQAVVEGEFPADAGISFEQFHAAIAPELAAPETAQYKRLLLVEGSQGPTICGWMNSVVDGNTTSDHPLLHVIGNGQTILFPNYNPDDLFGAVDTGILEGTGCGPIL
jgi:hypothetical protein